MAITNKHDALQAAVDIAIAYAGSAAQNKIVPETIIENTYKMIMELMNQK